MTDEPFGAANRDRAWINRGGSGVLTDTVGACGNVSASVNGGDSQGAYGTARGGPDGRVRRANSFANRRDVEVVVVVRAQSKLRKFSWRGARSARLGSAARDGFDTSWVQRGIEIGENDS
jgi:hypothetical protein